MDRKFHFTAPSKPMPVVFEQVFAERPGGGVIPNPDYDIMPGTAVDESGKPIKAYRLTKAVGSGDGTIQIAKGSGIVSGDVIGHGKKAVASTKVDSSHPDYDVVTVTMGVEIAVGTVLYQAKSASADSAVPIYQPAYVLGTPVYAGEGSQDARLINGANLRKETAPISEEVVAMMKNISLV
jgi:hypothetical protein|nr:MAG TPA: Head fiber protein [Caudoviricetes sp.]